MDEPIFRVGQVWADGREAEFTVIAITENQFRPIVVQDATGITYGHRADGKMSDDYHAYDLVRLVEDVETDSEMVA